MVMHEAMNSKKGKKESSIFNQFDDECVEDLVHQDVWL
jgi:hypothetical protein